jgi:hypothetical protein
MRRAKFESSSAVLPVLNTGGIWDLPTGTYLTGKHGEMILCGGLSWLTGIAGPGNTYKSLMLWDMILCVLEAYFGLAEATSYDTEMSQKRSRPRSLSKASVFERLRELHDIVFDEKSNVEGILQMTSAREYLGDKWYSILSDAMDDKWDEFLKEEKRNAKDPQVCLTTPFVDDDGVFVKASVPDLYGIDSLSNFLTSSVEKLQDEHDIGESGRNMEVMRGGMAKTQMMMELPVKTARGGGYVIMTAHVGKEFQMDPRTPPQKQLAFLKQGLKFKNVPEKFSFLVNNCWFCMMASPHWVSSSDRVPMYPRNSDDKVSGDTDLMTVLISNLRGKSGGSGMPFDVVVSQSGGVKHGLTQFEWLKKYNRFGLTGDLQKYVLDLLPDIKLSRTAIRDKLDNSYTLRRAMHITWEMSFIRTCMQDWPEKWRNVAPQELYDGLKAKGYDWNQLLETRTTWNFNEASHPREFLSTADLLNMYHDEYVPYWMKEPPKAAVAAHQKWKATQPA